MTTDTEALPREVLAQIILETKTKGLTVIASEALANAIVDALDRQGKVIADVGDIIEPPDEHLRTLKAIRKVIREAVDSGDTYARDLASLTRRLQDVSREVTTIEERHRADGNSNRSTKTNGSTADPAGTAHSQPLDI